MDNKWHTVPWEKEQLEIACLSREGDGDMLFFIHGLGCSMESFEGAWESKVLRSYALLAPDLPGFGSSSRTGSFTYDMKDHAGICLSILSNYHNRRIHLVGHSMGGAIAVILAPMLGKRVASLISIEGNLISEDCSVSRKTAMARKGRYREQLLEQLKLILTGTDEPGLHRWHEWVSRSDNEALNRSALSLVQWSCSGTLLEMFMSLRVPRLYVYGDRNSLMPVLRKIGTTRTVSISDSGHFPMVDNPRQFYSRIAGFLSSL